MVTDWIIRELPAVDRNRIAPDVPELVAALLAARGVDSPVAASDFLYPQLAKMYPPSALGHLPEAASRIADAVQNGRKIALYGDYDVDGTTGVSILWHVLKLAGATPRVYVPHRIDEGYGLNLRACRQLADEGIELVITVDCGITACDEARWLAERGVSLIITDHHQMQDSLPQADVIVHPAVGRTYENPGLCGAGVAFKLAWGVAQQLSGADRVDPAFRELLAELLPLAALGTIADIVPLTGENRVIAAHGMKRLVHSRIAGVRALLDVAGLARSRISDYDVGFKIAPRINAAGRMGHAELAVELLTSASAERAAEIAGYLDEQNRARQATEKKIAKHVVDMVDSQGLASDARRGIVVSGEDWHAGVIGIVAARLVARYHRPSVVIALKDGEGQGSARSIDYFDLANALGECQDVLLAYGGHRMAAGLRVAADRVDEFTDRFVDVANNRLTGRDLKRKLHLDAEVPLSVLDLPTVRMLEMLGPFGAENPKPRFCTDWIELAREPRCVGSSERHIKATFRQDGHQLQAIGFGLSDAMEDLKQHRRCKVAFEPIVNEFNGRVTVEMSLLDIKFPT